MKTNVLSLIGFCIMLFGIFRTKLSIAFSNDTYSKTFNFNEGYWLYIVIGLLLIIGSQIYAHTKNKEEVTHKKSSNDKLKWISSIRKLMQLGFVLTIIGIITMSTLFLGNQLFGIPQKSVEIEIPYKLSTEQINQLEQSKILPEDSSITGQEVMLNVGIEKIGKFSWLLFIMAIIILSLIAYGIYMVVQILKSSEQGEFFTYLNANRLKTIAHICIAYFVLYNFIIILTMVVQGLLYDVENFTLNVNDNIEPFVLGLLLYVLAHIWKEGVKMQEDLKLTI